MADEENDFSDKTNRAKMFFIYTIIIQIMFINKSNTMSLFSKRYHTALGSQPQQMDIDELEQEKIQPPLKKTKSKSKSKSKCQCQCQHHDIQELSCLTCINIQCNEGTCRLTQSQSHSNRVQKNKQQATTKLNE
jgi:hypothetical protein